MNSFSAECRLKQSGKQLVSYKYQDHILFGQYESREEVSYQKDLGLEDLKESISELYVKPHIMQKMRHHKICPKNETTI